MEELNFLEKINRVKAPPDFEQGVFALLSARKEKKRVRVKHLRFSFAGAFGFVLVFFVLINVFVLHKKSSVGFADSERNIPSQVQKAKPLEVNDHIQIIETVDYSQEIRRFSYEPKVIYILENVSYEKREGIKY